VNLGAAFVSSRVARVATLATVAILGISITVGASGAPAAPELSAISASSGHACVVTAGGGVKCWGSNDYGQLGDGLPRKCPDIGRFCAAAFNRVPLDVVGLVSGVETVVAGGTHTCALMRRGGVKCWGYNASGQLGNGAKLCSGSKGTCARNVSSRPVDVVGLRSGIRAIAAGEFHSCALTDRGGVKCWGLDKEGQLGSDASDSPGSSKPVGVEGLESGVAAIAAGSQSTCALTSGGAVKCWGVVTGGYTPLDVPGLGSGATEISVGWTDSSDSYTHACALTTGAAAKCWGINLAGELGDGSRVTHSSRAVDVVGLGSGIEAIAAGAGYTCAITRTGRVKCWGNLMGGRSRVPVDVPGLAGEVTAIAAGSVHTCVLPREGGAKCWGSNAYGKLGNGSKRDSTKPVNVLLSAKPSTKPSTPSPGSSKRCSEASARRIVKQLRLGDPSVADPVYKVLCGAFTGPGSQTMVVSLGGPGASTGMIDWVVFRWAGGTWQFLMKRHQAAVLAAAGSDIRETVSIFRDGDPRCCPTGGTKTRIWHWNGSRFVAAPWKQVAPGASATPGADAFKSGYFKTPSGNIVCYHSPGPADLPRPFIGCGIKSGLKPAPPRRSCQEGGYAGDRVSMNATGRVRVPSCAGDPGALVGESRARVLDYGKTWSGGGIRCTSAETGLTCRNKSGHGFFLSREHWRAF